MKDILVYWNDKEKEWRVRNETDQELISSRGSKVEAVNCAKAVIGEMEDPAYLSVETQDGNVQINRQHQGLVKIN